jgi:2-hydroxychromene-2-carboxylate isomerase
MVPAVWYYDVISPFAYIAAHRLLAMKQLSVTPVPVLFAGLLSAWKNKGPAEVEPKRVHTYQLCAWQCEALRIPFKTPAVHPFNPIAPLRALTLQNAALPDTYAALRFVWGEGRDPNADWGGFCAAIGADPKAPLTEAKEALRSSTERAVEEGVWGVPSLRVNGRVFWGADAVDWAAAFVARPQMFSEEAYASGARAVVGAVRKEVRAEEAN